MSDDTETAGVSWQAARVELAGTVRPVTKPVAARLTAAMEAEMMAKQLSGGQLASLATELLSLLARAPE